jgi:hypothetical protein
MTNDEIMKMTPEELRMKIALALGFTFRKGREWWNIWLNGKRYNRNAYAESMLMYDLPDWTGDDKAAITLTYETRIGFIWTIYQMWKGDEASSWSATIEKLHSPGLQVVSDVRCESTLALAVCRAFLIWTISHAR